jgi:hypothetical protein
MKLNETIWLAVLYVVVNTAARCDVLSVTLRLLLQRNPSLLLFSLQYTVTVTVTVTVQLGSTVRSRSNDF